MFLSNLRAGPTGDAGHDFWFQSVGAGGPTLSGSHVTSDTAMRLSTVYKCVRAIADTMGMLPMHLYQRGSGEQRDRVMDDPLTRLLAVRPNRWQIPMQFRAMLEAHRSMRGMGYAEIFYGPGGVVDELVPLHPDSVTPEITANGEPRYVVKNKTGQSRTLVTGEILVITGLTLDGYVGINPIQAEREAIGSAMAARDFGSRFWNNDARPPFYIQVPGKFESDEARGSFRNEWQTMYGGQNRGRPAVLDRGMEIKELGINNVDSQWIAARQYSDIDICGLWRVPPHKIGILDRATWANIEHQNIEWVTDCLLPLAVSWEQSIARDLIVDEGRFVETVLEILLRGDTTTRFSAYGKAIQDGWLTRNEARRRENLNPLPGLDDPLQPLNMTRANAALTGGRAGEPMPGRAAALLAANAQRVARKEASLVAKAQRNSTPIAEAFAGHARFVADVMAVPLESAAAYTAAAMAAADNAAGLTEEDWIETQVAALLRLEG
jgi:HK97 family phage portal protein